MVKPTRNYRLIVVVFKIGRGLPISVLNFISLIRRRSDTKSFVISLKNILRSRPSFCRAFVIRTSIVLNVVFPSQRGQVPRTIS
jgi:hypothetical protein